MTGQAHKNFLATFTVATRLLTPDTKSAVNRQHVMSSINTLADQARANDADAIELLLNFSAGPPDSVITTAAVDALLDVYADSRTQATVPNAIGAQACRLFEITAGAKAKQADRKSAGTRVAEIATPVLYLGGQHVPDGHRALKDRINQELNLRTRPQALQAVDGSANLLDRGRFTGSEELLAAGATLRSLFFHPWCLEMTVSSEASPFAGQLEEVLAKVDCERKPVAAFLNIGNHWITLVLSPAENDRSKVNALVMDTNSSPAHPQGLVVAMSLRDCLGGRAGDVHDVSAAMQTHVPNACGPLGVLALRALDRHLASNTSRFEELDTATRRWVTAWQRLSEAHQVAAVTVERARMLSYLEAPSHQDAA